MIATKLDSKRRVTLPPTFDPDDPVTITEIGEQGVIVQKIARPRGVRLVPIPVVDKLRDDAEMDGFSAAAVRAGQEYEEPA